MEVLSAACARRSTRALAGIVPCAAKHEEAADRIDADTMARLTMFMGIYFLACSSVRAKAVSSAKSGEFPGLPRVRRKSAATEREGLGCCCTERQPVRSRQPDHGAACTE